MKAVERYGTGLFPERPVVGGVVLRDAPGARDGAPAGVDPNDVGVHSSTSIDDRDRFSELYRLYRGRLFAFCLARTHDKAEAEDIVQQVFADAFAHRSEFEEGRSYWPWLVSIAARNCIDAHRRRSYADSRLPVLVDPGVSADPTPTEVIDRIGHERMARLLVTLPVRQRIALELYALEGWSYSEIASYLQSSVGTVRMLIFRARTAVRRSGGRLLGGIAGGVRGLCRRVHQYTQAATAIWDGVLRTSLHDLWGPVGQAALVVAAMVASFLPGAGNGASAVPPSRAGAVALVQPVDAGGGGVAPTSGSVAPGRRRGSTLAAPNALHDVERSVQSLAVPLLDRSTPPPDTEAGSFHSVAVSPSYDEDRTVFVSTADDGSPDGPASLLVTRDGGASWTSLAPVGLIQGARLLLPPAYPRDDRILAVDVGALRVSHDGGRSFQTLVALPGIVDVAFAPVFYDGHPTMLLVAGGRIFEYREGDVLRKLPLDPALSAHSVLSARYGPGFPSDPTILVATRWNLSNGWFHRCQAAGLPGGGAEHPNLAGGPLRCTGRHVGFLNGDARLLTPPRLQAGLMYLGGFGSQVLYVSTDEGATFHQLISDPRVTVRAIEVVPSASGTSAILARTRAVKDLATGEYEMGPSLMRTDDGGRTWRPLLVDVPGFEEKFGAKAVAVTPTGRIIAVGLMRGVICSADGGATWAHTCPTPDAA